jgi:hypothetical protein
MGEKQNRPFHFSFNSSLKVDFQGSRHGIKIGARARQASCCTMLHTTAYSRTRTGWVQVPHICHRVLICNSQNV